MRGEDFLGWAISGLLIGGAIMGLYVGLTDEYTITKHEVRKVIGYEFNFDIKNGPTLKICTEANKQDCIDYCDQMRLKK